MISKTDSTKLSWPSVKNRLGYIYGLAQIISNGVGIGLCFTYFTFFDTVSFKVVSRPHSIRYTIIMSLGLIILGMVLSNRWLKDIKKYVFKKIDDEIIEEDLAERACRKILNLPPVSSLISLLNWTLAALVMPFFIFNVSFETLGQTIWMYRYLWVAFGILISGFTTCVMVFFITELICRPVWGCFFPDGNLIEVRGVFRINLWSRILIIFLMVSLFPLTDMAIVSYDKAKLMLTEDPASVLESLLFLIIFLLAVEMSLVIALSTFMSRSIVAPILHLKQAMLKVEKGDFSARAPVIDNNELGELAQHFNLMTIGLKERYEIKKSLAVAEEVQQNLLPETIPEIPGLDIAGKSLYCDQTGGDYFDFIEATIGNAPCSVVAIGDVSGHGIPSALLMASARAFLRQRLALSGSICDIVNDVNIQFCKDVGDSGRFMTLLLCAFDTQNQAIKWVRAGHDPALVYDPKPDKFFELTQGGGIPLGIDDTFVYQENEVPSQQFESGQILFGGTDGIWESAGQSGDRFGKERVKKIIRKHRDTDAETIMNRILQGLNNFMGPESIIDDVTLIIVKKI